MPRPKKTVHTVPIAFRVDPDMRRKFAAACRKANIHQADVIRMGIRLFLSGAYEPGNEDRLG